MKNITDYINESGLNLETVKFPKYAESKESAFKKFKVWEEFDDFYIGEGVLTGGPKSKFLKDTFMDKDIRVRIVKALDNSGYRFMVGLYFELDEIAKPATSELITISDFINDISKGQIKIDHASNGLIELFNTLMDNYYDKREGKYVEYISGFDLRSKVKEIARAHFSSKADFDLGVSFNELKPLLNRIVDAYASYNCDGKSHKKWVIYKDVANNDDGVVDEFIDDIKNGREGKALKDNLNRFEDEYRNHITRYAYEKSQPKYF